MPPNLHNLDSDTVSVDHQASDDSSTPTSPQRATEDSPSSPPVLSDLSPTRVRDTPLAAPHRQNLGDRRRSSTSFGGRLAAPRRRLCVINSRRDSQRSVDSTPNRVVRPRHRARTIRDYRRTGSFLQYVSSVEDLSRAISGVQQTGQPQRGDRQPLTSHPSEILHRRTRTFQVRSWIEPPTPSLLFPIPKQHMIGQSIHTPGPQPSHPSTNRGTAPPAGRMLGLSRLSIDSQVSTNSGSPEHDTQPSVRPNRLRYPGHVLYCDCSVCDMLNEPWSP